MSAGVLVIGTPLAKGLEFDRVVVSDATAANYATEMDRNLADRKLIARCGLLRRRERGK